MRLSIIIILVLFSQTAWAGATPSLVFNNNFANMTYPSVAGEYLVYSQRVGKTHQIMRLKTNNLLAQTQDASAKFEQDVLRNGVALADGRFAYTSNRLGTITPWLVDGTLQTSKNTGVFHNVLLPNHLNVSANGKVWAFDSTLETARTPRIAKQFRNIKLKHELLGQNWRIYHENFWEKKSGYTDSKTGTVNIFAKPNIFTFTEQGNDISMLGDGFDASLSKDGSWMVFVREIDGNFDLWKQNIDGSGLQRLTKNTYADLEPSLSPDGKRVAFVSNRDSRGDILQTFIHVLDIATGKVSTVTSGMGVVDGSPAWFDANTIIFHSNRDPKSPQNETSDLWRLWTVAIPQ